MHRFLAILCFAVLCTILTLGLWPFHAPANDVSWLENRNGLRFGTHSTVISSGIFENTNPRNNPHASLEIWVQPKDVWHSGTLAAFYRPGHQFQFSLRQSQKDLVLRAEYPDDTRNSKPVQLYVAGVFDKPRAVFITITADPQAVRVYLDGAPVATLPAFPLTTRELTGRLILGDSPGQTDVWSGQVLGFALYQRQLTAPQVFQHYVDWTQIGRPDGIATTGIDQKMVALYLFDEHSGNVVRNKVASGVDLHIPDLYMVMDKIFLEPFWVEFSTSWNYWGAALKNIVGFIPFGFCFYAWLATLPLRRASLLTIALGTAVSLTIEVLQAFLPTRESGTSDLITNTLGTWIGVVSYRLLTPGLVRIFPWYKRYLPGTA